MNDDIMFAESISGGFARCPNEYCGYEPLISKSLMNGESPEERSSVKDLVCIVCEVYLYWYLCSQLRESLHRI